MRILELKFLLLLIAAISCNVVASPSHPANELVYAAKQAAIKMTNDPLINSVSIGLSHKGQTYSFHYGELHKGGNNTPTNETLYEIGSLSKVFAGVLTANAALENKINIEDDIQKYLNEEYSNLAHQGEPIKVRHLLTHTSGLPLILPGTLNHVLSNFLEYETPTKLNSILGSYSQSEFLEDLHTIEIETKPGVNYSYSSAGTELIAHILETVYEANYEALLLDFLVNKINMNDTKIELKDKDLKKLAAGYHADNNAIPEPMRSPPWGASGGMKSTTSDMIKFINYQLEGGAIIKESRRKINTDGGNTGFGYFWNIDSSNSKLGEYFYHHGGVPRAQSYIFILPKYDFGVFIITNQSGKDTAAKLMKVINVIFDELPPVNIPT